MDLDESIIMNNLVHILEVGPRDGLQNVPGTLLTPQKIALINHLLDCGFQNMEAGSFVRPDRVPAMADTAEIATHFKSHNNKLWYLVPNVMGLKNALALGVTQLAFFTAASDTFNQKNIGMTIAKSCEVINECLKHLKDNGYQTVSWGTKNLTEKQVKLRLYVSTVIACPYDGPVNPESSAKIINQFSNDFAQFSLGDTIGVGTPKNWKSLLEQYPKKLFSSDQLAMHCHDTYGTAIACVAEGLKWNIRTFDSSVGGLGGCPYAPGASGNLATEDLAYFLEQEGYSTGIKWDNLLNTFSPDKTGTLPNRSRVALAMTNKKS